MQTVRNFPLTVEVRELEGQYQAQVIDEKGVAWFTFAATMQAVMNAVARWAEPPAPPAPPAPPDTPARKIVVSTGPGVCNRCGHTERWHDAKGCRFLFSPHFGIYGVCKCPLFMASNHSEESESSWYSPPASAGGTATVASTLSSVTPERQIIVTPGPNHCNGCGHPATWHDAKGCRFMLMSVLGGGVCRCAEYQLVSAFYERNESEVRRITDAVARWQPE